jgi:hypothetical protein
MTLSSEHVFCLRSAGGAHIMLEHAPPPGGSRGLAADTQPRPPPNRPQTVGRALAVLECPTPNNLNTAPGNDDGRTRTRGRCTAKCTASCHATRNGICHIAGMVLKSGT